MHFDGSKLLGGLGAGVVLTSPKGDKLQYVLQMQFRASNNVAKYEALVHGLKMAKQIGIRRILCFGDSDLVMHQVSGDWDAKDANMASYRFYVQQLSGFFEGCEFHHVPEQTTRRETGCPRSAPPSRISQLGCPWRSSTSRPSNLRRSPYPSTCLETQPRLKYRHRTRGLPSRG
jgi:ribonuclease HI